MHSKPKLALAILTSPSAAFEEVTRRKLLGTAVLFVAFTGVLAMVTALIRGAASGQLQYFTLGKENPVTWLGLWMLYGLALMYLLRWLGTELEYDKTLIVLGWSHVVLILAQSAALAGSVIALGDNPNPTLAQFFGTANAASHIAYVILVGIGLFAAFGIPQTRGSLSYLVVAAAAQIALRITYAGAKLKPLQGALPGISSAGQQVVSADMIPWLGASAVGLALGLWTLAPYLFWNRSERIRWTVSAAIIGLAAFAFYYQAWTKQDYYSRLSNVQRMYDDEEYTEAADRLKPLLNISSDSRLGLMLDLADIYYVAGKPDQAAKYFNEFLDTVKKTNLGASEKPALARAMSGLGAAYAAQKEYDKAISEFKSAAKQWPEFKDPWVRLALAYNAVDDYDQAVKAGNHAVKKLDSEAVAVWVALTEAYARTGDTKQAKAAFAVLTGKDSALAKKIGTSLEDWKTATSKLTAHDLRFPLEKEFVKQKPQPKKPGLFGRPK